MTIDDSGFAVLTYLDRSTQPWSIRVLRCQNEDCSSFSDVVIDTEAAFADPTIILDSAGNPTVLYHKTVAGQQYTNVWLARCENLDCSSVETWEAVGFDIAKGPGSIAYDSDGILLWGVTFDGSNTFDFYLLRCEADPQNFDCETLFYEQDAAFYSSWNRPVHVSVDGSGFPFFAFQGLDGGLAHRAVTCLDADCSSTTSNLYDSVFPLDLDIDPSTGLLSHVGILVEGGNASEAQARYQRCLTPDCSEVAAPVNVFPDSAVETRDARAAVLPSGDLAVTFLEGRLERYATVCDLDDVCEPPTLIDSESSQYITGEAPVDTAPNGDILFAYVDSVVASGDAFELKLARLSRPQWQNVSTDDFETGLGSFSLGGGDARRGQFTNKSAFIYGPSFAIRLRDDSGVASSMESAVQDLSAFSEVRMTFWFSADSIEGQEDLLVEFSDGAQWNQVAQYVNDVDFLDAQANGGVVSFNNPEVVVTASQFDLSQAQFRICADASGNADRFFVDAVVIDAR